ncbi:MAG: calcium-binding protein, partial [Betaproteobacteria bacterium]
MSKSSERSRALNAARRFATSVRLRDNPVGRAVKAALSGKTGTGAAPAAAAGAPNWRIESLEPKLLLSADALPGVHQRVDADPLQTVQAPSAPADTAQGPGALQVQPLEGAAGPLTPTPDSQPFDAATYDAVADFRTTSNPAGVWTYGYSPEGGAGYAMTPFDVAEGSGWSKAGYGSPGTPAAWKNTAGSPQQGVGPGQVSLHPGPRAWGDLAILRFTAPANGLYTVSGQFFAGDSGSMSGSIVLNGDLLRPLQHFASTSNLSVFSVAPVPMASGETLDFVVGNNGSFYNGSTPLEVVIEATATASASADNLYLFGRGDGASTVTSAFDARPNKLNVLRFRAADVLPSQVLVRRVTDSQSGGNDALELRIDGTSDRIVFNGFFYGGTPANAFNGLQRVEFSDGTRWDIAELLFRLGYGAAGNESLWGTDQADLLNGAAGSDWLYGFAGNDSLYGGNGDDVLQGYGGKDWLDGGDGNDRLYDQEGDDTLLGGDGKDELWGSSGNDTLMGGRGDDRLEPGEGSNQVLFGVGDGRDDLSLSDYGGGAWDTQRVNTLRLVGVLPGQVTLQRVYDDWYGGPVALQISVGNGGDTLVVHRFFSQLAATGPNKALHRVVFADGTEWGVADIYARLATGATAGDDFLVGTGGNDTLDALAGNDFVLGGAGNDTLRGGSGNDTLDGGEGDDAFDGGPGHDRIESAGGSDTFLFGRGDGSDTVYYTVQAGTRTGTLRFKDGVLPG